MQIIQKPVCEIDYSELDELVNEFLCNEWDDKKYSWDQENYLEYLSLNEDNIKNDTWQVYEIEEKGFYLWNSEIKNRVYLSNSDILELLDQWVIDKSVLSHIIDEHEIMELYNMATHYMISTGTKLPKDCMLLISVSW